MSLDDLNSDSETRRLRAFARLLATRLYVPLVPDQDEDEDLRPHILDLADAKMVLGFVSLEAMSVFVGRDALYAEIPGAELMAGLADTDLCMGLNFGQADAVLLDRDAIAWVAENHSNLPSAPPFTPPSQPEQETPEGAVPSILRNLRPH